MKNNITRKMTGTAILLALVLILQTLGGMAMLPGFLTNMNLSLVPIAVGAIMFGPFSGAFLGFFSGLHIVLTGQAALFMGYAPFATVVVCLLKGGLSGLVSGYLFKWISKKNSLIAMIVASLIIPVVNTGVFVLAMYTVFMPIIRDFKGDLNTTQAIFTLFVGFNFFIEFASTAILSPVVTRLVKIARKAN